MVRPPLHACCATIPRADRGGFFCAVAAGAELGKPAANKRPTIAQRHAAEFKKEEGGRALNR